jgi:hypothetical protein
MVDSLLDGIVLWVQMKFMLNQFPRNYMHDSRLPCEDVPIFVEEFDEHEFLLEIQGIAYVSNIGRFLRGQRDRLAECVLGWMDVLEVLASGMTGSRGWGLSQGLL